MELLGGVRVLLGTVLAQGPARLEFGGPEAAERGKESGRSLCRRPPPLARGTAGPTGSSTAPRAAASTGLRPRLPGAALVLEDDPPGPGAPPFYFRRLPRARPFWKVERTTGQ